MLIPHSIVSKRPVTQSGKSAVLTITGNLDGSILKQALNRIAERHESLGAALTGSSVASEILAVGSEDLRAPWAREQHSVIERVMEREAAEPLSPEAGQLMRARLWRLTENEWVLFTTQHEVVADGWLTDTMVREIPLSYSALIEGRTIEIPCLSREYADYVELGRNLLNESGSDFWRNLLDEAPPLVSLPLDRPRRPLERSEAGCVCVAVEPVIAQQLDSFAQQFDVTELVVMLAVWSTLLSRISGQEEVVVGVPLTTSLVAATAPTIGAADRVLPLRISIQTNATVSSVLDQVKSLARSVFDHAKGPLLNLLDNLKAGVRAGHHPVYQAAIGLDSIAEAGLGDPSAKQRKLLDGGNHLDLKLTLLRESTGMSARLDYNSSLFDRCTVERIAAQAVLLLRQFVDGSDRRISELTLLSENERFDVVHRFNKPPKTVASQDALFHEIFEEQVAKTPESTAVVYEGIRTTYDQLNRRANRVAHFLRLQGVLPDSRVAICMERGADMLVAVLGVLKAGGAYVPLDANYPPERLTHVINVSDAIVVITERRSRAAIEAGERPLLVLDAEFDEPSLVSLPEGNLDAASAGLSASHLAYVIYTSGSTGGPKGVMVEHRSIVNFWRVLCRTTHRQLTVPSNIALNASYTFDMSMKGISQLLSGHCLHIVPQVIRASGGEVLAFLQQNQIDAFDSTPSQLAELIAAGFLFGSHYSPQSVLLGGESINSQMWGLLSRSRTTQFFNMYGPTECTVDATIGLIQELGPQPNVGAPIDNCSVYVLDAAMQPLPVGVAGEIYIGGAGVARGYLNRADLTREKFVRDLFSERPGARMYKTGDAGRWTSNGTIEFIGRKDLQIKVRGFRVELAEIETSLRTHPQVENTIVVPRGEKEGDQRLVAYVVPRPKTDDSQAARMIADWSGVFDEQIDEESSETVQALFDRRGWNSSYTRLPILDEEIEDWLESTLRRIHRLRPARVLEIGCGTGMVLLNVSPQCIRYCGLDLSQRSVDLLSARVRADARINSKVDVRQGHALDIARIQESFDTVVINSVAQYFPSASYLHEVVASATRKIEGAGWIFIGDVRNHCLAKAFHLSVQLHQADEATDARTLLQKVAQRQRAERELTIDPAWFFALQEEFPEVTGVQVSPKESAYLNEMAVYRFDVVLSIRQPASETGGVQWKDYSGQTLSFSDLERKMAEAGQGAIGLANVRNRRLSCDLAALETLESKRHLATLDELRRISQEAQNFGLVSAQVFSELTQAGYSVELAWLPGNDYDACHAIVSRDGLRRGFDVDHLVNLSRDRGTRSRSDMANDPLLAAQLAELPASLREHLLRTLPDFMVPSAFVCLSSLPINRNGKIDLRALPAPDASAIVSREFEAPRGDMETAIAKIWKQVLGVEQIGRNDDFFELGGHSLIAVQAISRLRRIQVEEPLADMWQTPTGTAWPERNDGIRVREGRTAGVRKSSTRVPQLLGVDVPLRELFSHPTLADFAKVVQASAHAAMMPVQVADRNRPLPLSWGQERLWFLDQLDEAAGAAYHLRTCLRLQGPLRVAALRQSLARIVSRHEALRTVFGELDGQPMQVVAPPSDSFDLIEHDLTNENDAEGKLAIQLRAESDQPFNLARGPLIRGVLWFLAAEEHVLLISQHHIASDGWSSGLFVEELRVLYDAYSSGQPDPLPDLAIQYADYAVWQRRWLQGATRQSRLDFWCRHLAGAPTLINLPVDRKRPAVQSYAGSSVRLQLPEDLSIALRNLGKRQGATLFMTFLTGWAILLSRLSGQPDLVVGTPVANRLHTEVEPLIGFFVNTLALRIRLEDDPAIETLLARVKSNTLDAYAHQDMPFEKVVQAIKPPRSLSYNPLFQVMLTLQNAPNAQDLELSGLSVTHIALPCTSTHFDLTLWITDTGAGPIDGELNYASDLFDRETAQRIIDSLKLLLAHMVLDPARRVSEVAAMTCAVGAG